MTYLGKNLVCAYKLMMPQGTMVGSLSDEGDLDMEEASEDRGRGWSDAATGQNLRELIPLLKSPNVCSTAGHPEQMSTRPQSLGHCLKKRSLELTHGPTFRGLCH